MNEFVARTEYVYSTLGLDPDLSDLVEMFVEELPDRIDALQTCWDDADMEGLGRVAHQLKGAAGSYGFEELTPALQRLDHRIRTTRPAEDIFNAIEEVADLCSRVRPGAPEACGV